MLRHRPGRISGVGVPGYNGTFTVTSAPANNPNRFTYSAPTSGLEPSGGGTVTPERAATRGRLQAFFTQGGGYTGTSQSGNNFTFLTGTDLLTSPLRQGSDPAGGGIAIWANAGSAGPVTGGFPGQDFLYLPSNITYFSAVPADATVDGRYLNGTDDLFLAGLWLDRDAAWPTPRWSSTGRRRRPVDTSGWPPTPSSRGDAEREWALIGQAALWSNLTDEA